MHTLPHKIKNVQQLEDLLSTPTPEVVETLSHLTGDLIILGVGGKIGPSLARMARRACSESGIEKRIIGVSLFESEEDRSALENAGIETIHEDMLDSDFLASLPTADNVIYMAGMKFGSSENPALTWAINSYLPALVAGKYKASRIVAFSTGCVYPLVEVGSGGSLESDPPEPVGEYAQSCLGRERMFEFFCDKYKTPVALIRLNYAVEMRYGVLVDIALKVRDGQPIDLATGHFNAIWQGDVNAWVLRALPLCESPVRIINITRNEVISVRWAANEFGKILDKEPEFVGEEAGTALLANATQASRLFGQPTVSLKQMILWIADWVAHERPILGKPTHFEVRNGKY